MQTDINHTIDFYIKELEQYSFEQLCAKPDANSWSMGQMYIHLIQDTNFYLEEIKTCITNNDNQNEDASDRAKDMFLNNELPNVLVKGSSDNAFIPQPESKQQLTDLLVKLKHDIHHTKNLILQSEYQGKTKHPGLNYFNAGNWLQFADMHFRHHLRQKKRIDEFLKVFPANY